MRGRAQAERQRILAEGASRSIRKTIRELDDILQGNGTRIRGTLRGMLYDKIEDLSEKWYGRGFVRGMKTVRELKPQTVASLRPIQKTMNVSFLGKRTRPKRKVHLSA